MTKYPMTVQGARALEEELKILKIERPKISQAIAEARELGDLKENAEYHAAREQQGSDASAGKTTADDGSELPQTACAMFVGGT